MWWRRQLRVGPWLRPLVSPHHRQRVAFEPECRGHHGEVHRWGDEARPLRPVHGVVENVGEARDPELLKKLDAIAGCVLNSK